MKPYRIVTGGLATLAVLLGCETASRRSETKYFPSIASVAYADEPQAKPAEELDAKREDLTSKLRDISFTREWTKQWRDAKIEEILKPVDYVKIDSTTPNWEDTYRSEVLQKDLEKKLPVFVDFYGDARTADDRILEKNEAIYVRAISEAFGNRLKLLRVYLPTNTKEQQERVISMYRDAELGKTPWLPLIRGGTTFVIYKVAKDGDVVLADSRFGMSVAEDGLSNSIVNAAVFWLPSNLFEQNPPKRYEYKNGDKLTVASSER